MVIIYCLIGVTAYVVTLSLLDVESELDIVKKSLPDYFYIGKKERIKYVSYQFKTNGTVVPNLDMIERLITGNLGKYVRVSYNRVLNIRVYKEELPKKVKLQGENALESGKVILGIGRDGLVYHDFRSYPHMVVAGVTGYGKTTFLRSLMSQFHSEDLVVLIDLKNDRDYLQSSATSVEEARDVLRLLLQTKKERGRVYVIIDEAAQLQKPRYVDSRSYEGKMYLECQAIISKIAAMGRSRGIHLIFATQYPHSEVIPREIKQNAESRVVFRVATEVASRVALDEKGAESLPRGLRGRALYKVDHLEEIQTFHVDSGEEGEVNIVKIDSFREKKNTRNRDSWSVG